MIEVRRIYVKQWLRKNDYLEEIFWGRAAKSPIFKGFAGPGLSAITPAQAHAQSLHRGKRFYPFCDETFYYLKRINLIHLLSIYFNLGKLTGPFPNGLTAE